MSVGEVVVLGLAVPVLADESESQDDYRARRLPRWKIGVADRSVLGLAILVLPIVVSLGKG